MISKTSSSQLEIVVFGGGCFWCTEAVFSRLKGVTSVTSGYAGGKIPNPNYFLVGEELTGHAEVVQVVFDPSIITYEQLLDIFWHVHDPTSLNQQGADVGTQYRSMILYTSEKQKNEAEKSKEDLKKSGEFKDTIVTEIKALDKFYTAEEYHQKYYERNTTQPYCQVVINPKIQKLLSKYKNLLKDPNEKI
jgi:peptide-methionine (S)-S-oxide reductase